MYMLFQYSCAVAALRLLWYMYLFITVMRVKLLSAFCSYE